MPPITFVKDQAPPELSKKPKDTFTFKGYLVERYGKSKTFDHLYTFVKHDKAVARKNFQPSAPLEHAFQLAQQQGSDVVLVRQKGRAFKVVGHCLMVPEGSLRPFVDLHATTTAAPILGAALFRYYHRHTKRNVMWIHTKTILGTGHLGSGAAAAGFKVYATPFRKRVDAAGAVMHLSARTLKDHTTRPMPPNVRSVLVVRRGVDPAKIKREAAAAFHHLIGARLTKKMENELRFDEQGVRRTEERVQELQTLLKGRTSTAKVYEYQLTLYLKRVYGAFMDIKESKKDILKNNKLWHNMGHKLPNLEF